MLEAKCVRTLCDLGRAITRLNQDVSALGTECGGNGLCKSVDAGKQRGTSLDAKLQLLFSHSVSIATHEISDMSAMIDTGAEVANLVGKSKLLRQSTIGSKSRSNGWRQDRSRRSTCQCSLHFDVGSS